MPDVLVIGGGVIGLSLAYQLAGQGAETLLVDQAQPGQEASWAGAGMLPPGNPDRARSPEARLRAHSHSLWPQLSEQLRAETGIDNGFRRSGGLELRLDSPPETLARELASWREEGVVAEPLSPSDLSLLEPSLSHRITAAYHLPELGQVRNPRHLKALLAACLARGVRIQPGTPVIRLERDGDRITAALTPQDRLTAGRFAITSGAWSRMLLAEAGCSIPLRPLRGQIVLLQMHPRPIARVLNVGPRYVVPREDGRILIGSTEEAVGFDKRNTARGVAGLLDFAQSLVPALESATLERTWAGLRPQSLDGLPYLGAVPGTHNLFVAAGHFRAGLQLSPITARLMTDLILDRSPPLDLAPYAPDRALAHHGEPGAEPRFAPLGHE